MASSDPERWGGRIERGSPSLEHAIFVLLGMVLTLVILVHTYLVFVG